MSDYAYATRDGRADSYGGGGPDETAASVSAADSSAAEHQPEAQGADRSDAWIGWQYTYGWDNECSSSWSPDWWSSGRSVWPSSGADWGHNSWGYDYQARDYNDSKEFVPEWDGKSEPLKVYERRVKIYQANSKTSRGRQGVKLLQKLRGDAFEKVEQLDPEALRGDDGVQVLLAYLKQ